MGGFTPIPRAEPSIVTGTRGPENVDSQRVIADVADEILFYRPSAAPFTVITGALREKRTCTQRRFDFLEVDEYPRKIVLTAAATSGATSVTITAGQETKVGVGYVMMNLRTREQFQVGATGSGSLSSLTRGLGGIQEAMESGDIIEIQALIAADGAGIGTLKSVVETDQFNYTEIMRWPYGWTGRQLATKFYGGSDKTTERKKQAIEHKKSIEFRFLFGRRHLIAASGSTHDTTMQGGLEYFLRSNVWDLDQNIPTEAAFIDFLEAAMTYGPNGSDHGDGRKWFYSARRWLTIIERWARDRIQYRPLDKQVGINVGRFTTAHGELMLVPTPILTGAVHGGYFFLCDMDLIRYRHMINRDTKLLEGRQTNDLDGEQEEYLTDAAVEVGLEASHAIGRGLPLAA